MADSGECDSGSTRKNLDLAWIWCCAFPPTKSPDNKPTMINTSDLPKTPRVASTSSNSYPSPINKLSLCQIKLSPGRVSPIDSENIPDRLLRSDLASEPEAPPVSDIVPHASILMEERPSLAMSVKEESECKRHSDVRLNLKGKNGRTLHLQVDSVVLRSNSLLFKEKIAEARRRSLAETCCSIEVEEVGNLEAFRETIELMYEKNGAKKLMKIGVSKAIDILEVCSFILFDAGIKSCLDYLEAVPWCEYEEEKLRSLLTRGTFNKEVVQIVLARLNMQKPVSQPLGLHIIQSVTRGINVNAKRELKSLVKGLLSTSSVYLKESAGIDREDLYNICGGCIQLLEGCLKGAYDKPSQDQVSTNEAKRPLIGMISEQVDNLTWLLEILMDRQMAEEFVSLWANQRELLRIHEKASPIVRYELSRVSASVFIAMGRGKLHCRVEDRCGVLQAWFRPMLMDFGWLQRCSKELDLRELEDTMGEAILTLPLKHQHILFMNWFERYSSHGGECPSLRNAFEVWWRRTVSSAEAHT